MSLFHVEKIITIRGGRGECPYPKRRGEHPYPERRVSLSQEERRGFLSQEERRLPNHLGEESRLPCTTHGERRSQVHLSWRPDLGSQGKVGAWSTTRQGSKEPRIRLRHRRTTSPTVFHEKIPLTCWTQGKPLVYTLTWFNLIAKDRPTSWKGMRLGRYGNQMDTKC